jgi:hypothetical protein
MILPGWRDAHWPPDGDVIARAGIIRKERGQDPKRSNG